MFLVLFRYQILSEVYRLGIGVILKEKNLIATFDFIVVLSLFFRYDDNTY